MPGTLPQSSWMPGRRQTILADALPAGGRDGLRLGVDGLGAVLDPVNALGHHRGLGAAALLERGAAAADQGPQRLVVMGVGRLDHSDGGLTGGAQAGSDADACRAAADDQDSGWDICPLGRERWTGTRACVVRSGCDLRRAGGPQVISRAAWGAWSHSSSMNTTSRPARSSRLAAMLARNPAAQCTYSRPGGTSSSRWSRLCSGTCTEPAMPPVARSSSRRTSSTTVAGSASSAPARSGKVRRG